MVKNLPANTSDAGDGFDPWIGKIPWRRKWQPTPVFLPAESHGQRNLVGYRPWGHKESDRTEHARTRQFKINFEKVDLENKQLGCFVLTVASIPVSFLETHASALMLFCFVPNFPSERGNCAHFCPVWTMVVSSCHQQQHQLPTLTAQIFLKLPPAEGCRGCPGA